MNGEIAKILNESIRILYVDDDHLDQKAFVRYGEENKLPYQITLVSTVAQASEKIKEQDFDVLVVDYQLADATGLDILRLSEKKPVILLTGNGSEVATLDIMKKGISDYVIKDSQGSHWAQLVTTIRQVSEARDISRRQLKLLLVEDDRTDQKAIARTLEPFPSYQLTIAGSIKEAKEHLGNNPFDLVILDVSLPDGTSTDLFPLLKNIPFIVTTGMGHEEYAARAYKMGATDYLIKDTERFYLKLLLSTIEKAFKQHEMNQLKKSLIGVASHELRGPLAILLAGSLNLKENLLGPLNEKQQAVVKIINENAKRLVQLIDNILDLSRYESGRAKMNRGLLNINALIKKVVHDTQNNQPHSGVEGKAPAALPMKGATRAPMIDKRCTFNMELGQDVPQLWGDGDMVERVLINLISNACRFAKTSVTVLSRKKEETVEIAVNNDGPGITLGEQSKLFNQFEQLRRPKGGGYKGTGLGLSICKEIVELHDGKIWVESSPPQGTQFYFTLPIDLRGKAHS